MNTQLTLSFAARGLLAAALAAGALGAHAASGFTIDQNKESQVQVGMSQDAVRQALGRPELNVKYMDEPGRTWSYEVVGTLQPAVFDVDFGADGTVLSVGERLQPDIN